MQNETISLYFTEGSSDKVYSADLLAVEGGFVVNFRYGRRGSALTTGTKTPVPVEYSKAKKIFDKLVSEKQGKGYTTAEDGTAYQNTENAGRVSGLLPMLLNPIDEADLDIYLNDPSWGLEVKADGERRMIRKVEGEIVGSNRKGLIVNLSAPIVDALATLPFTQLVLDGEDMGDGGYVAFDLLEVDNVDLRSLGCEARHKRLVDVMSHLPGGCTAVMWTTLIVGDEKRSAIKLLKEAGEEGVVLKKLSGCYSVGCPASGGDALKFKYCESASVEIDGHTEGKRSVSMRVYDEFGKAVNVGRVTIPANHEMPAIGSICECRYLYYYSSGSLFQPIYLGVRRDMQAADCLLSKLKVKTEFQAAA
jgi:bifunctional non-homologous end joining protein LigD